MTKYSKFPTWDIHPHSRISWQLFSKTKQSWRRFGLFSLHSVWEKFPFCSQKKLRPLYATGLSMTPLVTHTRCREALCKDSCWWPKVILRKPVNLYEYLTDRRVSLPAGRGCVDECRSDEGLLACCWTVGIVFRSHQSCGTVELVQLFQTTRSCSVEVRQIF